MSEGGGGRPPRKHSKKMKKSWSCFGALTTVSCHCRDVRIGRGMSGTRIVVGEVVMVRCCDTLVRPSQDQRQVHGNKRGVSYKVRTGRRAVLVLSRADSVEQGKGEEIPGLWEKIG